MLILGLCYIRVWMILLQLSQNDLCRNNREEWNHQILALSDSWRSINAYQIEYIAMIKLQMVVVIVLVYRASGAYSHLLQITQQGYTRGQSLCMCALCTH